MSDLETFLAPELLEQVGDAVTVIGADWHYRFVSSSAAAIIGRPADEVVGQHVWDVFPEVVGSEQHAAALRAMEQRTRERIVWYFETVDRWFEQFALPVADGLVIVVNDVSDREEEGRRSGQLVAIGERLAAAATAEEVNEVVARHVFPLVGATGGTVLLADEERRLMQAIGWTGDEAVVPWLEHPLEAATPAVEAYRTRTPVYVRGRDDARARFPTLAADVEQLAGHTLAALPLVASGRALGALLLSFDSERDLGLRDQQFLSTTAAMTAQALARAQLVDAERRTIAEMQRSLLPAVISGAKGVDLAVRYSASDTTVEVGGDWYDVIPLDGGGLGLVMGDVEGHDLSAAAAMGMVRSAVRAFAGEGHPPAVVLQRTNGFVAGLELERIVTLVYVELHPLERLVTTVSAGHPAARVVARDGTQLEMPTEVGPPLGVYADGHHWPETTSTLPARSAFVTFTDGLIEVRGQHLDEGIARVAAVLDLHRDSDPSTLADALLASRSPDGWDDVAILVARLGEVAEAPRAMRRWLPATPASVSLARRFCSQLMTAWGLDEEATHNGELVVSELVTNAARHSEQGLKIRISCRDGVLRIEVVDGSHRMPQVVARADDPDLEATSGRGLVLVAAVASRWGVESDGLGKQVWAELDLPS